MTQAIVGRLRLLLSYSLSAGLPPGGVDLGLALHVRLPGEDDHLERLRLAAEGSAMNGVSGVSPRARTGSGAAAP